MIIAWVLPQNKLSITSRESFIVWLDRLGKWSLIDAFVLVLMLVALRFPLQILPNLRFDVHVRSDPGFYLFVAATMFSLIMSHIMLWLHARTIMIPAVRKVPNASICNFRFRLGVCQYGGELYNKAVDAGKSKSKSSGSLDAEVALLDEPQHQQQQHVITTTTSTTTTSASIPLYLSLTPLATVSTLILLAATALFLLYGCTLMTFRFTFTGLAGYLLGDDDIKEYSLLTVGQAIYSAARNPGFGARFVQCVFYTFTLVMPFSYLILSAVLFAVPMSLISHTKIHLISEVCLAWSGIEVFILSVMASILQISEFAKFILGARFAFLEPFLATYMSTTLHGKSTPFDLHTEFMQGAVWLSLASISFMIVGFALSGSSRSMLRQRWVTAGGVQGLLVPCAIDAEDEAGAGAVDGDNAVDWAVISTERQSRQRYARRRSHTARKSRSVFSLSETADEVLDGVVEGRMAVLAVRLGLAVLCTDVIELETAKEKVRGGGVGVGVGEGDEKGDEDGRSVGINIASAYKSKNNKNTSSSSSSSSSVSASASGFGLADVDEGAYTSQGASYQPIGSIQ
jgi:hypothetical protein